MKIQMNDKNEEVIKMGNGKHEITFCPYVSLPHDDCHCMQTRSLRVIEALEFCQGEFERCDLYHTLNKDEK